MGIIEKMRDLNGPTGQPDMELEFEPDDPAAEPSDNNPELDPQETNEPPADLPGQAQDEPDDPIQLKKDVEKWIQNTCRQLWGLARADLASLYVHTVTGKRWVENQEPELAEEIDKQLREIHATEQRRQEAEQADERQKQRLKRIDSNGKKNTGLSKRLKGWSKRRREIIERWFREIKDVTTAAAVYCTTDTSKIHARLRQVPDAAIRQDIDARLRAIHSKSIKAKWSWLDDPAKVRWRYAKEETNLVRQIRDTQEDASAVQESLTWLKAELGRTSIFKRKRKKDLRDRISSAKDELDGLRTAERDLRKTIGELPASRLQLWIENQQAKMRQELAEARDPEVRRARELAEAYERGEKLEAKRKAAEAAAESD